MKILLIHNFYGSSAPSGENTVFLAEKDLLKSNGHQVIEYTTNSDQIRRLGMLGCLIGAFHTPWNPLHLSKIRKILQTEQPDIMHIHNTFPILSPSIFYAAKGTKTASVLTLHNYRLFCAAAIPMRDNTPCTLCLDKSSGWSALRYGCYRNSRVATLPMALLIALHRKLKTWQKRVDAFISLTHFQEEKLISAGLPAEKVSIKPHFYPNPPTSLPWNQRTDTALYIGRLGEEKGVEYLLDAWEKWGESSPKLSIIGDGPLRTHLKGIVSKAQLGDKVYFHGQLPFQEVQQILAQSKLLILPSICFEGFPMVIREAFSLGVAVAASNIGSIPCIVNDGQNGVLFTAGDSKNMAAVIQTAWENQKKLATMGKNSRIEFEKKYTAKTNHKILMDIYNNAILRKNQLNS